MITSWGSTSVLTGDDHGRYPHGNSLLIEGTDTTVIVDPSLSLVSRSSNPTVDVVLSSHAHEDHIAGNGLFPSAEVRIHRDDLVGLQSLEGLLAIYGMPPDVEKKWQEVLLRDFHYRPRADATAFSDNEVLDLGGTTVQVVHLPGHTRGHCGFLIEPDGVFYVGDIDLTGFGPYYGDAWSDLDEFETSLGRCREIDAGWFATFHHRGVVEGRTAFLDLVNRFAAVIGAREERLVDYLAEPHTMDDIVAHRFVYRPGVELLWVDYVERRMMGQHLVRLLQNGVVLELEAGRYRRA